MTIALMVHALMSASLELGGSSVIIPQFVFLQSAASDKTLGYPGFTPYMYMYYCDLCLLAPRRWSSHAARSVAVKPVMAMYGNLRASG